MVSRFAIKVVAGIEALPVLPVAALRLAEVRVSAADQLQFRLHVLIGIEL